MIIGDSYVFSIFVDVVEEWNNDKSFNNGLLFISVNGTFFPKKIVSATLNTELHQLLQKLQNVKVNTDIFEMEKEEAFVSIYKLTFPDDYDVDNDYSYNLTPFVLEDNNCFVFMVSNGNEIRILASELSYIVEESVHNLRELKVEDIYISDEKLREMTKKLESFQLQILDDCLMV